MSKKALIVWGGWDGHTPRQSAEIFARFLGDSSYDVTVSHTLDSYIDKDLMASLDLILPIWTMDKITDDQWKSLKQTVRAGCGFAGFHGGIIDSFRNNTEYQWMTGGQWVSHPGNVIPRYTVQITDHEHPITAGIPDFELPETEQYYCHVDPLNHVLATTTFSGEHGDQDCYQAGAVMPYTWTKSWGKGKVFVASWGHTFKDFDVPEAKTIVERGLKWATR